MIVTLSILLGASSVQGTVPSEDSAKVERVGANSEVSAPDADSADSELEQMRAVEGAAVADPSVQAEALTRSLVERLGGASLMRDRLEVAEELRHLIDEGGGPIPLVDIDSIDIAKFQGNFDIPVEMRPMVAQYIRFFQGAGRKWFRRWMSRSTRYIPLMKPILAKQGIPIDTVYLSMIESGFSTSARSFARAVGPWQFISGTAVIYNLRENFWVDERKDPVKSTYAAAAFLKELFENTRSWHLAWAGYNAGGGRVRRLVNLYGTNDFWELAEKRGFAKETKHYVPKLIACALIAKHPESFGFSASEFEYEPPFEFEEVPLKHSVDVETIAAAADVEVPVIMDLNPELKHWVTPPITNGTTYVLRVPKGKATVVAERVEAIPRGERPRFATHHIQRGDTLSRIAAHYHSAPEAIMRLNSLASARLLRMGTSLVIPLPVSGGPSTIARQVALARAERYIAPSAKDELPAGTHISRKKAPAGLVTREMVGGRSKVTYGIAPGDTLWGISRQFAVGVNDLKAWNPAIASSKKLRAGMAITIWENPGATSVAAAPRVPASAKTKRTEARAAKRTARARTHKVRNGDNMWSISRRYSVSVDDLRKWNGIDGEKLLVGQSLVVAQ